MKGEKLNVIHNQVESRFSLKSDETFVRNIGTLKFHSYFSNRMVLQSNVKNNIWGFIDSDADEENLFSKFHCRYDILIMIMDINISIVFSKSFLFRSPCMLEIKWSENKQQPGASRSGHSQWEEAKLGYAVEKLENFHIFFNWRNPLLHF